MEKMKFWKKKTKSKKETTDSSLEGNQSRINETAGLAEANNHLAVALFKLFAKKEGNVFFSPFSISCAMAMLYQGANSQAATELRTALGYEAYGIRDDVICPSFKDLLKAMEGQEEYSFNCANTLVLQKGFAIKERYLTVLEEMFEAFVLEVDFQKESPEVLSQINEWVSKKTGQMIPRLLDCLDPEAMILLLNAVYFKGIWNYIFDPNLTCPQPFYNRGLDKFAKDVPMMNITKYLYFTSNKSYSALVMPFKSMNVAMMLILPQAKNGLKELERQIDPFFVQKVRKCMSEKNVKVALPKFRVEYQKSLKDVFQAMGVKNIFQVGADLGGMSDCTQLVVSEILHKAVVDVNELGCEAAAVTSWCEVFDGNPHAGETFVVDHPFLVSIFDTRSKLQLFMGRVEDLR